MICVRGKIFDYLYHIRGKCDIATTESLFDIILMIRNNYHGKYFGINIKKIK